MLLTDQVVVVTGAGHGIGRAIALRCGAEGARVALTGRSVEQLHAVNDEVGRMGRPGLVVPVDVRDPQSVAAMAARVSAELGPVDVLIANSGIGGPTAPLWEVTPEQWDEVQSVNVRGVFLTCRALLPGMLERRSGSVVVVGSMSSKRPMANRTPYAASKSALIGLVRTLAWETGPYGVRVNLVSPGPVAGPRLDDVLSAAAGRAGRSVESVREDHLGNSPLRRLVDADEVAAAVVFLASAESAATTGEDLNVSAGITLY